MNQRSLVKALYACGARPCLKGETAKVRFLAFQPSDTNHGTWGVTIFSGKQHSHFYGNNFTGLGPALVEAGLPADDVKRCLAEVAGK